MEAFVRSLTCQSFVYGFVVVSEWKGSSERIGRLLDTQVKEDRRE